MRVSSRIGLPFRYGLLALSLLLAAAVPKVEAATTSPRVMKLLVIGADGTEPEYGAVTAMLDQVGVPYDTFLSACRIATATTPACPLPTFVTGTQANYYGIILTQGIPIATVNGVSQYTLGWFGSADWQAIDSFTSTYGIRTLVMYDYGSGKYGYTAPAGGFTTPVAPSSQTVTLTKGQTVFTSIPAAAKIPVSSAWMVLPTLSTGATSVLSAVYNKVTYAAGVLYTPASTIADPYYYATTPSSYLTLTMEHNPNLLHTLILSNDLVKWVTNGVFLGYKKAFMSPQVDDLFIPDDLYDKSVSGCYPMAGFSMDPVSNFANDPCPTWRIKQDAVQSIASWEASLNAKAQTKNFRVTIAFNGVGTVPKASGGEQPTNDTLVPAIKSHVASFYFLSHTYDHPDLDCYSLSTTNTCVPADTTDAGNEITKNVATLATWNPNKTNFDGTSMVTPEVSGLGISGLDPVYPGGAPTPFIQAAVANGIQYLVSDTSKTGIPGPNQGIVNCDSVAAIENTTVPTPDAIKGTEPQPVSCGSLVNPANPVLSGKQVILEVPRFPTNIFYNVWSPNTGVSGSELDEYNYLYGGPGCLAGTLGWDCLSATQTYAEIETTETNNNLTYILKGYANATMYHQTNFRDYSGNGNSLISDVLGKTITAFESYSNLPIISQPENEIGQLMWNRMAYNASGVVAVWTPAATAGAEGSISLTVNAGATIPVTFVGTATCATISSVATCENYGGETIAYIPVDAPLVITSPK
jgi:hypothetical protein